MNEIKITTNRKELIYNAPASFNEMTREQFILTAQKLLQTTSESEKTSHPVPHISHPKIYYLAMTGIPVKTWNTLHFYQRYTITHLFDFITEMPPLITKQLLPFIVFGNQQFIGYQPSFSNTTWQEFIFADQYILTGKFKEAVACLYRPQRPDYNGETDRRIPFTIYGTSSRLHFFNNLPEAELLAFVLNYKSLRKIHLEEKYPFIFQSHISSHSQPNDNNTDKENSQFSWVSIHRSLMGDHFYDESKFYELNVHIILNRMNVVIQENRYKRDR